MVELDSQKFDEPNYSIVTGRNRIFRFAFLAEKIEEQIRLLRAETREEDGGTHSYPTLPPSPTGE
jgi:hypothetical protein